MGTLLKSVYRDSDPISSRINDHINDTNSKYCKIIELLEMYHDDFFIMKTENESYKEIIKTQIDDIQCKDLEISELSKSNTNLLLDLSGRDTRIEELNTRKIELIEENNALIVKLEKLMKHDLIIKFSFLCYFLLSIIFYLIK